MATTGSLVCPRDGTTTQLTCVECGTPICPVCMVRTPVGLICPNDVAQQIGPRPPEERRPPVAAVVAAVALVAVMAFVGIRMVGSSSDPPSEPLPEPLARTALGEEVRVGSYAVRLTRFECGARQLGDPPNIRTADGRFCIAHFLLRRVDPGSDPFTGPEQVLTDGTRRFPPVLPPVPGATGPPSTLRFDGSREVVVLGLRSGEFQGMLIYDLPETSTPTEMLFHDRPNNLVARVRLPS